MRSIKIILISLLIPIISISQNSIEIIDKGANVIHKNYKDEISFYKNIDKEKAFSNSSDFFAKRLNKSEKEEFKLSKKGKHANGHVFEEYHQYYDGIPVKSGVFVLHKKNGIIASANGNYIRISNLNSKPSITEKDAKRIWCNFLKIPENEVSRFNSKLLIVDVNEHDENAKQSQPALAYKIRLYTKNISNALIGFIDARSGKVCLTEPLALTSSIPISYSNAKPVPFPLTAPLPPPATGTFATRYSGTQTATTESRNSLFFLEGWTRGDGIETLNLEDSNAADTTGAVSFSDNNNSWTEYDNDDYDNAALDVHWALQEVYDFFEDEYSRSGWDDSGQKINAFVHAIIDGSRDNAAYYSGEYLAFGDGQSIVDPFVSLDAVAHEYGHGINDHTSGFGNSGLVRSFNEGLSDIWAATIEDNIAPQKNNWLLFEEIMKSYDCERNLEDPDNSNARWEMAHTFGTPAYNGDTEEYYRSGIMSHWFYRLSEGGSGTNGLGNNYNVYELGIETAADLVYHAQSEGFLNGTTTYPLMRTNMVNAAEDLFGENSFHLLQVEVAWYAVGVGTQPTQPTVTGANVVCNSGSTYSANNSPSGSTINWTTSSNLKVYSGQGTTTPTIKPKYTSSQGDGWVQANYITVSDTTAGPRRNVWVGKPSHSGIELGVIFTDPPYDEACINQMITLGVKNSNAGAQGVLGYHWEFGSWSPYFMGYENMGSAYFNSLALLMLDDYAPETQIVGVSAENGCGCCGGNQSKTFYAVDCGGGWYMSMYPNPASDYVTVSFVTNDEVRSEEGRVMIEDKDYRDKELKEYTIEIWDEKRGVVKRVTSKEKYLQIPVNDLAPGRYYFHLIYNGQTYKQQLIVE